MVAAATTAASAPASLSAKLYVHRYAHGLQADACKAYQKAKTYPADSLETQGYYGFGDGLQAANNHLKMYAKQYGYKVKSADCPPTVKADDKRVSFPFKKELKNLATEACQTQEASANAAKGNNESDARYFKRFSEAMRNARQRLAKVYKNQGGQVSPIKC
jgi:hypothetical protein